MVQPDRSVGNPQEESCEPEQESHDTQKESHDPEQGSYDTQEELHDPEQGSHDLQEGSHDSQLDKDRLLSWIPYVTMDTLLLNNYVDHHQLKRK